ncbi:MAG TPA: NtaA/DmoA family FMN-dependent monooxygenase [Rhodopila sp.]|uniref:NtaA/DmoA family FMN-dependent monooxygenase n=1 Tax=Rhodopila sp. TaxID=2480087 RepID=UPI002C6D1CD8|nr:NtaA/DmoA family FMN-dependent monooxygenase [Rhodopila sp.]HVY15869.1 NtaA/DmoA family FMN-dependent monooxygenase [Rhodopila sp.]
MPKPMHLAWFTNFTQGDWTNPVSQGTGDWDGKFFIDMAQAMERACFDYIMLEDTLMVSEAYGGTAEATLKYALQVPKHDPIPLASIIAANTTKLGVVATMSTLAWPPFMLARVSSTLDHIAGGRFGWNIVTSGEDIAAQNFGLDKLPPREARYAMADEYVDVVCKLFESWEPDAVVKDHATGTYADHTKVHPIHFEGQFFKVRGPLNTVRSPQGKPVFVQAGGSPRGRAFAARHADSIIAVGNGIEGMKKYRDDVRRHAAAAGRDPDDIKVLFLVYPTLGETDEEAQARHHRMVNSPGFVEAALAAVGTVTDIDFSGFDLDKPLPPLTTNGEQGSLDKFAQWGSGKTLRQLAQERFDAGIQLIGSPDTVADRMGEAMEAIGGDGFLISTPFQRISRRFVTEVCEGLVPALQRRGLARKAYTKTLLRDTLREF